MCVWERLRIRFFSKATRAGPQSPAISVTVLPYNGFLSWEDTDSFVIPIRHTYFQS